MASWTDILPKFTPYVQQLPVEAMVQVGMQKQTQYNQGVEKIQGEIDKIAGLDIARDVDKNYLQKKLNSLGDKLTFYAAGDFSDFQLTNSVAGMTKDVVKDPIVENAVSSTAHFRNQQKVIEKARKEGKSSIENEWWFNSDVENWLSDANPGAKFSSNFIEYRDIDKKLREIASKIKDVDQSVDIPFQRDDAGNVLYFKKDASGKTSVSTDPNSGGEKRVDNSMLRVKVKGTSAQKILDNFYISLDENDKQQLMITGNYHYKDSNQDTLRNDVISTYKKKKEALQEFITDSAVKLKTLDLSSAQRSALEAAVNEGSRKLKDGELDKKMLEELKEIDNISDMKSYRYKLYTQKYLTNLASAISNESRSMEILSNPDAQMIMEKKKLSFQVERAKVQDQQFWAKHAIDLRQLKIAEEKWQQEQKEKEALQPIVEDGELSTGVSKPTLSTLETKITETKGQISILNNKYGSLLFPNLTPEQREQALDKLVDDYSQNPNSITDPEQTKYVESARQLKNQLTRQNNLLLRAIDVKNQFQPELKALLKNEEGIFVGNKMIYSPSDLMEVYVTYQESASNVPEDPKSIGIIGKLFGGSSSQQYVDEKFIEKLPQRLKPIGKSIIKEQKGEQLSSGETVVINTLRKIAKKHGDASYDVLKKVIDKQSDFIATNMPEVQSKIGTLNVEDKVTKAGISYLIGNMTDIYNKMGTLDGINKEDFDPSVISGWIDKLGYDKLKFVAEKKHGGDGFLRIYNGNEKQIIPMTASQLNKYFPKVARSSPMTPIKEMIMSSPARTTNFMGVDDPTSSYFSGYDIPGLRESKYAPKVRFDIKGSPDNDGGNNDEFKITGYVYDGSNWIKQSSLTPRYVNSAEVEEILNSIGEQTIKDIIRLNK